MTTGEVILIGVCVGLVMLPPRYDPAIRWKEWLQRGIDRRTGPAAICARDGHDWQHHGGRNAGCDKDCYCSVPVYVCARCGDCDYGKNREAGETIAACRADRIDRVLTEAPEADPTPMRHRCATCGTVDGHEPGCAENDPPEELPEGVFDGKDGKLFFNCRGCDKIVPLEVDVTEFDPDVAYCGGSPWCLP